MSLTALYIVFIASIIKITLEIRQIINVTLMPDIIINNDFNKRISAIMY
jgi:hypothetical protein